MSHAVSQADDDVYDDNELPGSDGLVPYLRTHKRCPSCSSPLDRGRFPRLALFLALLLGRDEKPVPPSLGHGLVSFLRQLFLLRTALFRRACLGGVCSVCQCRCVRRLTCKCARQSFAMVVICPVQPRCPDDERSLCLSIES